MSSQTSKLEQARELFQANQLDAAAACCRDALNSDAKTAAAHHLLGLISIRQQHYVVASEQFRQAIACDPSVPRYYVDLGKLYRGARRMSEALTCFLHAVKLAPQEAIHHIEMGNTLRECGEFKDAEACYREAVRLEPRSVVAQNNLGNALADQKRDGEALACFQQAVALAPESPVTHMNLGACYQSQGMHDEAVASLRQALALDPNLGAAHHRLGNEMQRQGNTPAAIEHLRAALRTSLQDVEMQRAVGIAIQMLGDIDEAKAAFARVLAVQPTDNLILHNMIVALFGEHKYAEAQPYIERLLQLNPNSAQALDFMATSLTGQGQAQQAVSYFERAIALSPDNAETHYFYGVARLTLGDLETGWREFLWRRKTRYAEPYRSGPLWKGEDLSGQTIAIYGEGGLGDTFQFVRFVPLVEARAGKVLLEVPGPLVAIMRQSGYTNAVQRKSVLEPDVWQVSLLDLAAVFGSLREPIPTQVPYLLAEEGRVTKWREKLSSVPGLRVGINWRGSRIAGTEGRSIPLAPLAEFAPLAKVPGVTLVSLQRDPTTADDLRAIAGQFKVVDFGDELDPQGDFMDTAAIIKNLDLIVSCDTSVAHLAGGLGGPVWLALSDPADWRWMLERADCPWYPNMRLFRQPVPKDWSSVMQQIAGELSQLARS